MLKPCPFCGCEAVLFNEFFDDYLVMCSNSGCAAEGPLKATSDEAETAWNTRLAEVVEALYPSIETALNQYRCQYTRDDEGDGLPLADILSPGETIREGEKPAS